MQRRSVRRALKCGRFRRGPGARHASSARAKQLQRRHKPAATGGRQRAGSGAAAPASGQAGSELSAGWGSPLFRSPAPGSTRLQAARPVAAPAGHGRRRRAAGRPARRSVPPEMRAFRAGLARLTLECLAQSRPSAAAARALETSATRRHAQVARAARLCCSAQTAVQVQCVCDSAARQQRPPRHCELSPQRTLCFAPR